MWLDFKLFGNGYGMGMPFWDGQLYWLVDTLNSERYERNGRFYIWIGGFGAQLKSFEWSCPRPGTQRRLGGRVYTVYNAYRRWPKWSVSWATHLPQDLDERNKELREIEKGLGKS
jgi:hypothetical protein